MTYDPARGILPQETEPAFWNKANQGAWKQWAGGPVKQQNKLNREYLVNQKLFHTGTPADPGFDYAEDYLQPKQEMRRNARFSDDIQDTRTRARPIASEKTKYIAENDFFPSRWKKPLGKLPLVGALPMPTTMQGAMQDEQSGMDWRERMLRFLSRSAGVDPNYNPEGI
jgi:hypothetical protein